MTVIRGMTAGDTDAVLKLAAETPEAPNWDRAVYERMITAEGGASRATWAHQEGQQLQGFAVAHSAAGLCELESIVVAKSARRKGIGRSLLGAVAAWALAKGAQKVELEVRASNESAIAFYLSAGFRREGLRRSYYREPDDDAVLMGKPMSSDD